VLGNVPLSLIVVQMFTVEKTPKVGQLRGHGIAVGRRFTRPICL